LTRFQGGASCNFVLLPGAIHRANVKGLPGSQRGGVRQDCGDWLTSSRQNRVGQHTFETGEVARHLIDECRGAYLFVQVAQKVGVSRQQLGHLAVSSTTQGKALD
jgi:hypothetical protein